MAQTIEIEIARYDAETWLGDTSGVDVDQTVRNYASAVEAAVSEQFPEAWVMTKILPQTDLRQARVSVDGDTEADEVETVNDVLNDVFSGGFAIAMLDGSTVA